MAFEGTASVQYIEVTPWQSVCRLYKVEGLAKKYAGRPSQAARQVQGATWPHFMAAACPIGAFHGPLFLALSQLSGAEDAQVRG